MPLPQDIRPVFQDIQDTLVRSEAPWIQQSPMSAVKVLWVGRETGTWASLHHWKKGYVAPPHKHLAGAHAFIISGKLQVRNGVLNAGDYVYEPSGILHDATTVLPGHGPTTTISRSSTPLRMSTAVARPPATVLATATSIGCSWRNRAGEISGLMLAVRWLSSDSAGSAGICMAGWSSFDRPAGDATEPVRVSGSWVADSARGGLAGWPTQGRPAKPQISLHAR